MRTLTALALMGALAGCNTFEGFGRDLAAGGAAIEEAAVEAQRPAEPVYRQPAPQQQPIYRQPVQPQVYQQPAPQRPTYGQPEVNSQYVY
jgi:predicted small secreted protein